MKSYLRFLSRNKLYTAIEVVGLSLALAFVIPLLSYYISLGKITKGHDNYENIYSMCSMGTITSSPGFGDQLKSRIPEIEKVTSPILDNRLFQVNESRKKINYVDKDFFYFFPGHFTEGDAGFIDIPDAAAVSTSFAEELAKTGPVIGRKLVQEPYTYTVSAVFDEYGSGVLSECDMLVSNKRFIESKDNEMPFGVRGSITVFSVNPSAVIDDVTDKIKKTAVEYWGPADERLRNEDSYHIVRYDRMTTGNEAFIGIQSHHFSIQIIIGIFCMLLFVIALLNYINLNAALTTKRSKEMALRKLNGADKSSIFMKYCLESITFTTICFLIGLLFSKHAAQLLHMFLSNSGLGDADFTLNWTVANIASYIGVIIITGLICGIIPAMLVSRFTPLDITKGNFRYYSKKYLNRFFIGFESVLSIVLIAVTVLMDVQYKKMREVDYNCDIEDVFYFMPVDRNFRIDEMYNKLKGKPEILKVGIAEGIPGFCSQETATSTDGAEILCSCLFCDEDAFDTFGFEILMQNDNNDKTGLWTTPLADMMFAEHSGLLENIMEANSISSMRIAGQVHNFPSQSYRPIDECITMVCVVPSERLNPKRLAIKTIPDHKAARKVIAEVYEEVSGKKVESSMQFEKLSTTKYIREFHLDQISEFKTMLTFVRIILILVILMTMMGLTGISVYFASERRHETAVRKVFGGTIKTETARNIVIYLRITLIAYIIAIPVIFFLFRTLTMSMTDKVESTWWIYLLALLISLCISLVAVLWQSLYAARTNPAEALKKE